MPLLLSRFEGIVGNILKTVRLTFYAISSNIKSSIVKLNPSAPPPPKIMIQSCILQNTNLSFVEVLSIITHFLLPYNIIGKFSSFKSGRYRIIRSRILHSARFPPAISKRKATFSLELFAPIFVLFYFGHKQTRL